jgi:formate hydrogenlyase subunit 6/NADH:ubiquinone oxidoreductase subunit I
MKSQASLCRPKSRHGDVGPRLLLILLKMKSLAYMLPRLLSSLFRRPFTVKYPFAPAEVPPTYRGELLFYYDACVGCRLCVRDCPAFALELVEVTEKKYQLVYHLGRCAFCGQCEESCPQGAIALSTTFDLATSEKGSLTAPATRR